MEKFKSKDQFYEAFAGQNIVLSTPGVSLLLNALTNDNLTFSELAGVLEKFPSVAVKIISLANSAWSAPLEPITDLKSACSRLGVNIVKSVSIALAVSAPFNTALCPFFKPEVFWSDTMLVADVVTLLLPRINESLSALQIETPLETGTTRTAALLHNLGLLFITHYFPQLCNSAFQRKKDEETGSLNDILEDVVGVNSCDGGSVLAKELDLPQVLTCAMTDYDNDKFSGQNWPVVAIIFLALELVSAYKKEQYPDHLTTRFAIAFKEQEIEDLLAAIAVAHKSIDDVAKSIKW